MYRRLMWAAPLAVAASLCFGSLSQAATYSVSRISDNYWGGTDLWHVSGEDVIARASSVPKFDITSVDVARTVNGGGNGVDLTVTIHTGFVGAYNFGTSTGPLGTGFGSLFIGRAMTVPSGSSSKTDTFSGDPGRFSYVVDMPVNPGTTGGAASVYHLNGTGSDVQLSYYPVPSQTTNPSGAFFRNNQAVGYKGSDNKFDANLGYTGSDATAPGLTATWAANQAQGTLTFTIFNENGIFSLLNSNANDPTFVIAWAMTCANDTFLAAVSLDTPPFRQPGPGVVPLPGAVYLMGTALLGLGGLLRRRKQT